MDIAIYIVTALTLAACCLMAGLLFAERGQRRAAQKAAADALELLTAARVALLKEMQDTFGAINTAHNAQAQQLVDLRSRIDAVSLRADAVAAGRLGPTHGSTIHRPSKG